MTGEAETSTSKSRLTSKEKGKGKRKRPAPVSQAAPRVDDEDVVDSTKRQFTRSTRQNRGEQILEVSQHPGNEAPG
jgi:hypothetical protein